MNHLYNISRSRVAISINPQKKIHLGHLYSIIYSKAISKKFGTEFHLRFDNVYAKNSKSFDSYPSVNEKWKSGNPHVPVPGRCIWEIIRPPYMTCEQIEDNVRVLSQLGYEFDKIYKLSDVSDEIREHITNNGFEWVSDLPIYFTEDLVWKNTFICRGVDWKEDSEHGYWVKMQKFLLENIKKTGYQIHHIPHITDKSGLKISSSNPDHNQYIIRQNNLDLIKRKAVEFEEEIECLLN